ncbi:dihydroxyacetone kinase subunit DhaK [Clostridium perfringens]|uniref:phosphoenolpyruvate--glycerone phosphotransferase n=1 Tax=Clostridium perfringens TaxID=1502 RepID=A0AAW9K2E7_CLOPF|nr:dihydroxyacetone kinase subunit DhaK [Clostridium perfringens]
MKKIMNSAETLVREMCNGMVMAHPELEFLNKYKVVKKKDINEDKVTLISGGGSGHEPAHAGFIGKGMLDVAVCGDVFASPSQIQIYQAIKASKSNKGTLLIIKNYSGDMMNFKNAAHLATEDGIKVDYIKVDDDIAVEDSLYTVGRRGVAGTVLVHKIAGAAAERGNSLEEVKRIAEKAASSVKSIGFAFTSCTVPAKGTPTFELGEDEMEYGVGIHGEPGIRREKIATADELAERMVNQLINELDYKDEELVVLVNGFGATPLQELYLLNNSVFRELHKRGIKVCKNFVGNYMTSIDMAGASLSIMKLDDELKELMKDECDTPAFKVSNHMDMNEYEEVVIEISEFLNACSLVIMEHCGGASGPIWGSAFRAASKNVINKDELTVKDFAEMMQEAVLGIQKTGERSFGRGAVVGDKTLIDALVPCADSWTNSAEEGLSFKEAFKNGAEAAVLGAKKTEEIVARMGRAGTVGERSIGYPDAGAYGLGVIFTEISNDIK